MKSYEVRYYDGRSSRPTPARLELYDTYAQVAGRVYQLGQITVGAKLHGTMQAVNFDDGSYCELSPNDTFILPEDTTTPLLLRLEHKLRYALLAFAVLAALTAFTLTYGASIAANLIAPHIPESIVDDASKEALELLDAQYMQSTMLTVIEQHKIAERYRDILGGNATKLHFRRSKELGANAFALPSGDIVLLDGLVRLDKDPELRGVIGVLAHEKGHVVHLHGLKALVKSSISSAILGVLIGDFSGLLTSLATFTIDAKYSRDYEREADQYVIDTMSAHDISTTCMADLFEAMADKDKSANASSRSLLSTHPAMDERIKALRAQ
jgi:Zn-dependent protease with chaperone function